METMHISRYMQSAVQLLVLQGICSESQQQDEGVPCRIRVGPRRFLNVKVHPEALAVTIWQQKNGQVTYRPSEPVETSVDANGILTVDMVDFVGGYTDKDAIVFCNSEEWKLRADHDAAYTSTLITDHAVVTTSDLWLDAPVTCSRVYFAPGALTLCGHDVHTLEWHTLDPECGAAGKRMRSLVAQLISKPHTVSADALSMQDLFTSCGCEPYYIRICTDRGTYSLGGILSYAVGVALGSGDANKTPYTYSPHAALAAKAAILLQLMQAGTQEEIDTTLDDLCHQGLLTKAH